jgi:hypothetical protein
VWFDAAEIDDFTGIKGLSKSCQATCYVISSRAIFSQKGEELGTLADTELVNRLAELRKKLDT